MPPKFKREYGNAHQMERQSLLDGASDDEDFFLTGPTAKPRRLLQTDGKVTRLQGQVHEVIGVMQDNIGKVLDRGERLDDLQDKSENLSSSADRFRVSARSVRHEMCWRECKMRLIIAAVVFILLTLIIVPIIIHFTKDK